MNRWLVALTEWLIGRLKRDPDYRLEGRYTNRDLVGILSSRGGQAVRGLFLAHRVGRTEMPIFSGRRIVVRHGSRVTIGRAAILGDDVQIDALSDGGLHLARNVTIGRGSTLTCAGVVARPGTGIWIGERTGIGEYSHIGGQGGVRIGRDVIIGPGLRIFSENHRFEQIDRPIRDQGEERHEVVIEDGCWLGSGVTVLAGVRVGADSVVGAGAIVTRSVPPRSIAVGAPARFRARGASGESVAQEPGR